MNRPLRRGFLRIVLPSLIGVAGVAGCGSDPPPEPEKAATPPPAATAAPAPNPAAAPAVGPGAPPSPAAPGAPAAAGGGRPANPNDPLGKKVLREEVRKRFFKQEDFVEGEANRDPFHSFLSEFQREATPTVKAQREYPVLLERYALDELKLIAIVGPPSLTAGSRGIPSEAPDAAKYATAKAMFLDPGALGSWVSRATHFSKNDAKVVRVDAEKGKVYVELKEDLGGGKFNLVEKVIELHAGEPLEGLPSLAGGGR